MNVQAQLAAAAKQRYAQMNGIGGPPPPSSSSSMKKKQPIVTGADPSASQAARKAAAAALAAKMGKSASTTQVAPPPVPKGPPPKKINSSRASALSSSLAKKTKVSPAPAAAAAVVAASSRAQGGPLSAEEVNIASQYRKMMKIGMPEGAVRHKMDLDGVAGHIVEAVFSSDGGASHSSTRANSDSSGSGAVSSGGGRPSSLSPEEENIASQYRKMMKIGMPEGALRHKMNLDGVSDKIQDAVIAGPATASSTPQSDGGRRSGGGGAGAAPSTLSVDEEKVASQYRKMMKIGMPEGAVRHKMNLDGVSGKIQDSVIAGEASPPPRSSASGSSGAGGGKRSSLGPEEEKIADQYRKMMKIGMPEGAVRHKMNMDGVSVKIQNSVVAGEVASSGPSPGAKQSSSSQCPSAGKNFSSLSAQDEQIAAQYRRMMKVGMPEGALRHKMSMDGVSAIIQDSVIAGEVPNPNAALDTNEEEVPIRPVNPMAAAIAASQGMGSLKKATPVEKDTRDTGAGRPSNPLAAAIAASGGQGALKKASANARQQNLLPQKPQSTNSIAAELAASGFKNSLKKSQSRAPQGPPKPHSTNNMASMIAASGFQNSLRKTSPQKMEAIQKTSSNDSHFAAMLLEQRKSQPRSNEGTTSGTKRPTVGRVKSIDSSGQVSSRTVARAELAKTVAVPDAHAPSQEKIIVVQKKTVVEKAVVLQETAMAPQEDPVVPQGKPVVLTEKVEEVAVPPKSTPITSSSYIAAMVENRKAKANAMLAATDTGAATEASAPLPEQVEEKPDAAVAPSKVATTSSSSYIESMVENRKAAKQQDGEVATLACTQDVQSPKDVDKIVNKEMDAISAVQAAAPPAVAAAVSAPSISVQPKTMIGEEKEEKKTEEGPTKEAEKIVTSSKFFTETKSTTDNRRETSNGVTVEKEKRNGEVETATQVQKVKELDSGHQEVVVATATVTTDGTLSSGKRTRERKRKPKEDSDKNKQKVDDVDHHCACIVM